MRKIFRNMLGAAVLFLASCSPKTEYTHALPKDASVVVSLDLQGMADKAGIQGDGGRKITAKLTELLKGGLEGDAAKLAEKIVNEPSESGLSFTDKVYLFVTPHANAFGVVMKVDSEGKLEDLLEVLQKEQICSTLQEESGCRWAQMGQVLCAFNGGTFLLMQNKSGDADNLKGMLLSLMRQQEGDGFAASAAFGKLLASESDMASVIDFSVLPDQWTTPLRMGLSADIRLEDIKYLVTTDFEVGRVVVNTQSLTENPKILSFFQDMDKVMTPIQGKYLEYYPAHTLAWTGGRIHGKTLYGLLCQNPTIRQIINNPVLPVDVERIFSAIDGDYALGYTSLLDNEFLMYADVTNDSFLETFEDLRPLLALTGGQVKLFDTAENQYALATQQGIYWFGVKKSFFYVTNDKELAEEAGRTYGVSLENRPLGKEVEENRLFASIHLSKLLTDVQKNPYLLEPLGSKQAATVFKMLLAQCDYVCAGMPDWGCGKMEIVLKEKDMNPLRLIVQMLENL